MKKIKIYLNCLFKGHTYKLYYKSPYGGHELWYCEKCIKEKFKL